MKSTAKLVEGTKSIVDNGREHAVILDLPKDQGGENFGATALELAVMGLSGCISTIFALVAKNSGLEFSDLEVIVDATKGKKTIEKAECLVKIKTVDEVKAEKVLDKTLNTCPVGLLFEKAGVEIAHKLIIK